jgi:hypothetical protein
MEITDTLLRALLGAALLLLYAGAWIAGVVYVSRDAHLRGLPGWLRALWVLLALVPMLGLTIYVYYYSRLFTPSVPLHSGTQPRMRITLPRAPTDLPRHPTMPVAALRNNLHIATAPVPAMARDGSFAPEAAPLRLAVVEGPHSGQEFAIGALPAQIGRGAESLVRLDGDLGVSRRHAELYQQAGVLRLRDLRSAHGTLVNGFTINDKGLMPGDKIQVGHLLLVVRGSDGRR